uniref:melanoma-associated antigen B1-like n=1 Tax=Jaculus jaculus TaxID=51337 RepID=UPI0003330B64|nr:melanoma-associated antigen B1-like [Jaculus jaculus]
MHKGPKSKGHSPGGKHQSASGESQSLQRAQPSEEEPGPSTSAAHGASGESSSASRVAAPTWATPRGAASTRATCRDSLTKNTSLLLHLILDKYEKREPVMYADMQKLFTRKERLYFSGLLMRASKQLELVYGLELNEPDSKSQPYILVSKPTFCTEENLIGIAEVTKKGLLMYILGVIFMKGNCASEEDVWEFLNLLGVYAGNRHLIFGEPRSLIARDFVHQNYLEYRQVLGSAPPRYEFLWGPRAYVETTKMDVLETLAEVRGATPNAFPHLYQEALEENEAEIGENLPITTSRVTETKVHSACKSIDYTYI